MKTVLEHVNVTVANPEATAALLCRLFDWKIRWEGPALGDGYSVHVGTDDDYIALYRPAASQAMEHIEQGQSHQTSGMLNHIGIVVDDLDEAEARILAEGFKTLNHGDYEPGRRFYFYDGDRVEYEVVSYMS